MHLRRSLLLAAASFLLFVGTLGGCRCNEVTVASDEGDSGTTSASANAPSEEQTPPSAEGGDAGSASAGSEAPPTDLYPGTSFGELSGAKRTTFVDIAKQEVCPCPDTPTSLHRCLQSEDASCGLARRASRVIARGLTRGISRDDILSTLAKYMEKAKKKHDFELEPAPRKGPEDAEVRIVEFADFECPHCKRASKVLASVRERFGDRVAIYFKHYPLPMHENAQVAARAAVAAQEQGKFWPMYELLFENQKSLSRDKITGFARTLGLNVGKFEDMMGSAMAKERVEADRKEGSNAGVGGTPAIFINGRRYIGPVKQEPIVKMVKTALEEGGTSADDG